MTRRELANLLLSDESKLDEEVIIFDNDTSQYYKVDDIETIKVDILPNGKMKELLTGRFARFRDKDAIIKEMTIISWKERCDWKK